MTTPARRSPALAASAIVQRLPHRIDPSIERVVAMGFEHDPERVDRISEFVAAMPDLEVNRQVADLIDDFGGRHPDLVTRLETHAARVCGDLSGLGHSRILLLGALCTQEYAVEGAAITNPSIVAVESGPDDIRFVLSMRAVGEGHISSLRFRQGSFSARGDLRLDPDVPLSEIGHRSDLAVEREGLASNLLSSGAPLAEVENLIAMLPPQVISTDVEDAISRAGEDSPMNFVAGLARMEVGSNYSVNFGDSPLESRVIVPGGRSDSRGIEDARFVRFDGPTPSFLATYTAYDGRNIVPQLLRTTDFRYFELTTMSGKFARNKGIALFPRTVAGSYVALTRHDQTSLHLAWSDRVDDWPMAERIAVPARLWELIQIGNCGSPIETESGWLVILHGVGPMRRYVLGAMLLDLDDPTVVLGSLPQPLLEPLLDERGGYVPNVVYSCGGVLVGNALLIPHGIGDRSIGFAVADLQGILSALE